MRRSCPRAMFLLIALLTGRGGVRGEPAAPANWPAECPIQPGQKVILLGDSIMGPGMYGHVANALLDRLYPGCGITFTCYGRAGTTAQSILPHLPEALKEKSYDWVLLNFGHNDGGRFTPEEFTQHGRNLLEAIRKISSARLGWMSVLGAEPTPYADDPGQARRASGIQASREKHVAIAQATKALCESEKITYVPLHETFAELLRERAEQRLRLSFTMDVSHPNLLGNWLAGASLLQALGLRPAPLTVELLQGEATSDQARLPVEFLRAPLDVRFKSLFLHARIIPPTRPQVKCRKATGMVSLDGRLDEWRDIAGHAIVPPTHVTWELAPRCASAYAASVQTCHDDANLYLAFRVKEPEIAEGTVFPEIIEVFVDARKDTLTNGNVWHRTKGLTQFCFHRDFRDMVKGPTVSISANGDASQGEGVRAAAARTDDGYSLEAAIPLANFREIQIGPGTSVPWDWAVSFTDQSVNLDWMGLMSRTQSTRGYGLLTVE